MLPMPEKALSESMEKGGRKMQGEQKSSLRFVLKYFFAELYGQEVSYYGESLIATGEAMNQLGDMRYKDCDYQRTKLKLESFSY